MLEKTAASLDQRGLQRVIPAATATLRSNRRLHTSFWHHGAATSVELSEAWQSLMHGTIGSKPQPTGEDLRREATLTASSFLLDFLYPNGAVALMRRWASTSDRSGRMSYMVSAPRLYTSSAARATSAQSTKAERSSEQDRDVEKQGSEFGMTGPPRSNLTSEEHQKALQDLLTWEDARDADQVWIHYRSLDHDAQTMFTAEVMSFLSATGRLADSWKVSELFDSVAMEDWDDGIFVAGAAAEVKLQNSVRALEIFTEGLSNYGVSTASLVHILDLLLDVGLRSSAPDFLAAVWSRYPEISKRMELEIVTPQLKLIAKIPDLAEKALSIRQTLFATSTTEASDTDGLNLGVDSLEKILVRRAVTSCNNESVLPLLELTKDSWAFEEYLKKSSERHHPRLAKDVYNYYRSLPGTAPSHPALYEVFKAYIQLKATHTVKIRGLDMLWEDWHKYHEHPSERAFQRYLSYFANLGDKDRVHKLWIEYVTLYADANVLINGSDTFAHLLHVHAVLGEAGEVQRIFDDMRFKFFLKPNLFCWNILLDAYAKAKDYDRAIETFEELSAHHKPDRYSYGTMMQMAGSRGDLGYTTDLYRKARANGLRADSAILNSLVDAYCQNDLWSEAQDVCVRGAKLGAVATRLWNKLLHYHALRRDLAKVNQLLQVMADKGVPYDLFTYEQLLLGLSLCRQADHALHLLTIALKDNLFEVTNDHFYIVMGAFIKTGQIDQVLRLSKLMGQHGFYKTSQTTFRLAEAFGRWRQEGTHSRSKRIEESFLNALRNFRQIHQPHSQGDAGHNAKPSSPVAYTERSLVDASADSFQFGTLSYLLMQLKDFAGGKDLVRLYQQVFGNQNEEKQALPVPMLTAMMSGNLAEGDYEAVAETWTILFYNAQAKVRSKDYIDGKSETRVISPKYRYILCTGLRIMLQSLAAKQDAFGMQELIAEVRAEGFSIDSKTWNYYIQSLSELHRYKDAFIACEEILMPGWQGWARSRQVEPMKNQLPLEERRKGSAPRYLRPITTTLYKLARGYMELDKMAPWSNPAGRMIAEIEEDCPQTVRAINSIIRIHSGEEQAIFESDSDIAQDESEGEGESGDSAYYESGPESGREDATSRNQTMQQGGPATTWGRS